jgi:SAM-dependent methyltransferase
MRADWIASRLPLSGDLIDVGFAGESSVFMHQALRVKRPDTRLIGADLNERRVRELGLSRTLVADALALPFATASVDAVIAAELLEHLPNPQAPLAEFARILKPGAPLVITTPNPFEWGRLMRHWLLRRRAADAANVRRFLGNPDHKGFIEPLSFCNALRRHGLEPVELTTLKLHIPLIGRVVRRPVVLGGQRFPLNRVGAYLCIDARRVQ